MVRGLEQADCGGDHTRHAHTYTHIYTHTPDSLTYGDNTAIGNKEAAWLLLTPQRVQIIQLANVSD